MAAFRPLRDIQKLFSDSCRLFTRTWLKAIRISVNEAQTAKKNGAGIRCTINTSAIRKLGGSRYLLGLGY